MNGCVLYLPFYAYGAEQTTILDISGKNHHSTTITATVPDPAGRIGWYFNGTSSVITINDPGDGSLDPSSGAFTFVAWVYVGQVATNICLGGKSNGSNQGYEIFRLSDNSFRLQVFDATGTSRTNVTGQGGIFNQLKYYHIVGIGNNATIQIYVNTKYDNAPATCVGFATNSQPFRLGRRGTSASAWWLGNTCDVMFFQRTWTFEEILSHYETTRFRYGV
jgi:hypothetical protein